MTPEPAYFLRPATPADLEFIKALHKANFKDQVTAIWGWDETMQSRLVEERFDPAKLRIIQSNGKDIGALQTEARPEEVILENIQLLPDYQRRGLGSKIIRDVLADADAAQLPVTLTVLRTNPARSLYERFGFFVTRQDEVRYYMRRPPGSGC